MSKGFFVHFETLNCFRKLSHTVLNYVMQIFATWGGNLFGDCEVTVHIFSNKNKTII
jgi:hypothetical protein